MRAALHLLPALLLLLVAPPADAQSWQKPSDADSRKDPVAVQDFSPKSGSVGTEVTIQGRGFDRRTQLLVGGRPVQPTRVQGTTMVFKVPAGYGDGTIVLRHPGVARDIAVGRFSVAANAQITSFAPQAGVRGARVEISGSGFGKGDRVLMNGKELEINRSAPKRLVVTISGDATTDYLTLVSAKGGEVRTSAMFRVTLPAPTITGMAPESGLPGTTVRLSGDNFTAEDKVFYGKNALVITARGPGYVEVVIPQEERTARILSLSNPNGQARSAQAFQLQKPATVKRIAPTSGKQGTRVVIYGSDFQAGDQVSLAGKALDIVELRANQISAEIPQDASSGPLVVERGPMRVASKQRFDVVRAPVVRGFEPRGGKAGARVTITGEHFSRGAVVYYGAKKLRVVKRQGTDTLVVQLPKKLEGDVFRVQTEGGEARSDAGYEIHKPPVVSGATPTQGVPGTSVTLSGQHMGSIEELYLGDTRLEIETRAPDKVVAIVPLGAKSGKIKVQSFGQAKLLRLRFDVLPGPEIELITPTAGPPGVELVVDGKNMHPESEVFLGDTALKVVRRENGRVVARVPQKMKPGTYDVLVRAGRSEARSLNKFAVIAPAIITGFTPDRVDAGDEVVIRGRNFDMNSKVFWGDVLVPVISVGDGGNKLIVRIPARTLGARYLMVESGGVRAQSRAMLEVVTARPNKTKAKKKTKKRR